MKPITILNNIKNNKNKQIIKGVRQCFELERQYSVKGGLMDFSKRYSYFAGEVLKEHKEVFDRQNLEDLEQWIDVLAQAERIFVVGAGREGIAAKSFSMRLMHLGKTVHWVWDDTAPGMGKGDLFIAINGSGKIGHIDYLIRQARETGASIAAVTGAPKEKEMRLV